MYIMELSLCSSKFTHSLPYPHRYYYRITLLRIKLFESWFCEFQKDVVLYNINAYSCLSPLIVVNSWKFVPCRIYRVYKSKSIHVSNISTSHSGGYEYNASVLDDVSLLLFSTLRILLNIEIHCLYLFVITPDKLTVCSFSYNYLLLFDHFIFS